MCIPLKRLDGSGLNPPPNPSKTRISITPPARTTVKRPWVGKEGDFEAPNID